MKKKLKLNLDDLKVESFVTTPDATQGRGTVFGQMQTESCVVCTAGTCQCPTLAGDTCQYPPCGGGGTGEGPTCAATQCTCGEETCQFPSCGDTNWCGTGYATDCPGQTECGEDTTQGTCYSSCTAAGCSYCDMVC